MPNLVALIQVFHKHHGNFFFTKTCLRLNHLCLLRKSGAKNLEMQIQIVLETKLGENGLIYCWLVSKNCAATSRQWYGFSLLFFFSTFISPLKKTTKLRPNTEELTREHESKPTEAGAQTESHHGSKPLSQITVITELIVESQRWIITVSRANYQGAHPHTWPQSEIK